MTIRPARRITGFFTGTSSQTIWFVPRAALSDPVISTRSMKIIRRLQSFAPPEVATSVGSTFLSAASETAKSSCSRTSALFSTKVSAIAGVAKPLAMASSQASREAWVIST
jgi:hypothetical protein